MKKTKLTSDEYRRKLEHQIYLAQEHPARIYDLSDCNLTEIPRGVFSFCKVLRKYCLNVSHNRLTGFESGGSTDDLAYLGVLVLSKNSFRNLPISITKMINLKKLIIDHNKLQKFPVVLTQLPHLRILNLEGNFIKSIPKEVNSFKSLEHLNILNNPITTIAPEICEIPKLKILKIPLENVMNVESKIIKDGLHGLWIHFCKIKNIPFKSINDNIDGEEVFESYNIFNDMDSDLRYTKIGNIIEQEIMEHELSLSKVESDDRRRSMNEIKKLIQQEDDVITAILSKKQHENDQLLNAIKYEEMNTNELINRLLEYNNQEKKKEELRNQIAERTSVYDKDDFSLTKKSKVEILNSMQKYLEAAVELRQRCDYNIPRTDGIGYSTYSLSEQDVNQKLAFVQLLFDKDLQLCRLQREMEIIERKLQQLSVEDMIVGSLSTDQNRNNRTHLVNLLTELKSEKDIRENILNKKIERIENLREENEEDFWIVQYQKLLDDKAKSEEEVKELLRMASMEEWIPNFLKQGYTIDMMLDLTMEDLNNLQIKPEQVRLKFINFLNEWKFNPIKQLEKNSQPSAPLENICNYEKPVYEPSFPSAPPIESSFPQSSKEEMCGNNTVLLARKEAECCICLTFEARILLLNCGHICCCKECSSTIKDCPLCRQKIIQRVNLEFSI